MNSIMNEEIIDEKTYKIKKLLNEASWDDEETIDEDLLDTKKTIDAHKTSIDTSNSINDLHSLDKKFDNLYNNILNDEDDIQLFSSKIQRIELKNFSQFYNKEKKEKENIDEDDAEKLQADLQKLFNNESNDILKIFQSQTISNNRKDLYEMYDEIADVNFIAYRMLRVYLDNILVKNIQNKSFISLQVNEENKGIAKLDETQIDFLKRIINMLFVFFDLQGKIKNQILPKMLKYGDYYVEIVNLNKIDSIITNKPQLLTENYSYNDNGKKQVIKNLNLAYLELPYKEPKMEFQESYETKNLNLEETFIYNLEKFNKKLLKKSLEESDLGLLNDSKDEDDIDIEDIIEMDINKAEQLYLRLLDPAKVLKIDKDGVLYGYLVIEDLDDEKNGDEEEINLYKRFLSDNEGDSDNKEKVQDIAELLSDKISKKLGEFVKEDYEFDDLSDELKASLRIIIYYKLLKKSKLKFRFLEPGDMINFHTVIDKFAPYGTSIFDPIIQPVKMYTIGLMTSIVSRLSRASVVRKWNIEVGNRRNYKDIIEQVKKDLKNKSVTYDSLNSIKNISKIITDFRDIATVTREGQRFIDLEILPMHDRSLPIQELQDLKNELIAATGIPAVYLNSPDTVDLRETLVNLNVNFANTIMTLQSYIEDSLNELMNSIVKKIMKSNGMDENKIAKFNISNYIKIHLNTPLVLQLQQNEALVGSIVNIIGALQQAQMSIDPEKLLEMYIPQMNWETLKKSGENLIKDEVKKQIIQQQAGQGQGGF